MIFLTEWVELDEVGNIVRKGGRVEADSWEEAEELARLQGAILNGRLEEEIDAGDGWDWMMA